MEIQPSSIIVINIQWYYDQYTLVYTIDGDYD